MTMCSPSLVAIACALLLLTPPHLPVDAQAECKALRDLEPWPNVPDEPDADAINAWLIKARITAWPEWVAAAAETIQ